MNGETHDIEDDDPRDNLHYRCVYFKNGEKIIAGIPTDDIDYTKRQFIEVYTPVVLVETTTVENGSTYEAFSMRKWCPLAEDDYFEIATDTIQTMFLIKPKYEENYFATLDRLYFRDLQELLQEENLSDEVREDIEEEMSDMVESQEEDQTPEIQPSKYLH